MGLREDRVAATPGRFPDSQELTPLVVESVLKLSARPLLRWELSLLLRSSFCPPLLLLPLALPIRNIGSLPLLLLSSGEACSSSEYALRRITGEGATSQVSAVWKAWPESPSLPTPSTLMEMASGVTTPASALLACWPRGRVGCNRGRPRLCTWRSDTDRAGSDW